MTAPSLPMEGGCRCGQVRFKVTAPPMLTGACHCTGCQRMTGGPYSLSVTLPAQGGFEVTAGEPVIGGLHGEVKHFHCPWCMSWVFTRADAFGIVNVRATMLDETGWFVPFIETYTDEKLPWVTTPARRSFAALPAEDEWPGLVGEYQRGV